MESKAACCVIISIFSSSSSVPIHSIQRHINLFLVLLKKLLISEASTDVDEYLKLGWAAHGLFPAAVGAQFGYSQA